jgi:hypothetical protein
MILKTTTPTINQNKISKVACRLAHTGFLQLCPLSPYACVMVNARLKGGTA